MITLADHTIPRIGMGCWAIGGPFYHGQSPWGYGACDDAEALRTIAAAFDHGVRLFDTADVYGAGHSEHLLGQVLENNTDAVIVTKFGVGFDPLTKQVSGPMTDPAYVSQAITASLRRLRRERLDTVLLHLNTLPVEQALPLFDMLEEERAKGRIGSYGWSTDFPDNILAIADRPGCEAVEHAMNVFFDAPSMGRVSVEKSLVALLRAPLAMGVLTGKFSAGARIAPDDVRANTFDWMDYFKDGHLAPDMVKRVDAVRELLTVGGRSLGQGALCWLLARSDHTIAIPGARTVAQAEENAAALAHGPLPPDVMADIETILDRPPEGPPRER